MDQVQKDRLIEEKKQRDFMDILEKASAPTNADAATLRDEILAVGICEAGTLRGLVEHIFNKANEDVAAQATLAELCQLMPQTFEPAEKAATTEAKAPGSRGTSEKRIDFRLTVLKKCKEELEKGSQALKACRAWEEKETKAKLKGEDKQNAEVDRAAYARLLTSIQFCGCLYTSGVLTEKIIQSCVDQLLKADEDPRSENMEILANLMTKIGAKFEGSAKTTKDKKTITKYFDQMQKIRDDAVSKDIAKMMGSVLTLRENNWEATAK
mmetsp:Transcript_14050/g.31095  ORF Transcript_14050/g.31095 Transcript_14050/m.31095 type:complete len:268 (-) Transcript_14050:177-980(-)